MLHGLIENIALLALLSVGLSLFHFSKVITDGTVLSKILIGVIFGTAAAVVMFNPIVIPLGATFDTRGGPAILVAMYGGPISAVIASLVGAIARYQVGGPSAIGGIAGFVFYLIAGLIAARVFLRGGKRPDLKTLIIVAIFGTICVLPSFFIGQSFDTGVAILQKAWWMLLGGNIAGVLILGLMLEMDFRRNMQATELEKARQQAVTANRAKSEFLSSMSHDLRTPLNAIMGFSDMIRAKTFGPLGDDHYEEYANYIHSSGTLLVSLINDVLDLSKIEAGKYELSEEHLDVANIIENCSHQLSPFLKTTELTINIECSVGSHNFLGDERVLTQLLNNLLSNAVKFSPNGGAINILTGVDENVGVFIAISDNGIGMSPAGIEKALRPFEQADGMHTRQHEGTGLGLHLCSNMMKLFDGEMKIESIIHEGTTVTLHFPPSRTILAT